MSLLNECPICGAALDPGERCDCEEYGFIGFGGERGAGQKYHEKQMADVGKKVTNAERIRQMTDEALSELLKPICMNASEVCKEEITFECAHFNDSVTCKECWLDWLKQEVPDGGPKD